MPMLLEQIPRTMAPDTTDLGTFFRGCARVKRLSPVTCSPDGRTDSAPARLTAAGLCLGTRYHHLSSSSSSSMQLSVEDNTVSARLNVFILTGR